MKKVSMQMPRLLALAGALVAAALVGVHVSAGAATTTGALVKQSVAGKIVLTSAPASSLKGKRPIVIGGTLGLTGAYSGPSTEYKYVYGLWQKQVNSSGHGLAGRPVKMIIYDDQSNPAVAQSLYERLLTQDKVDLVLAPYTTFVGGAVTPLVLSHQKLLFNGGYLGIKFFDDAKGWMIGSFTFQEPEFTLSLFNLISQMPKSNRPQRIGVLTAQNPFTIVARDGSNGKGGVLNYAKRWGINVVMNEEYPAATTNMTPLIQEAKQKKVDLLIALSLPNDAALIARTVKQLDFHPRMYCSCGSWVTTLPYWPDLGDAGNFVIATSTMFTNQPNRGLGALAAAYQKLGKPTVPVYAAAGYAILQVLQQAVDATNGVNQGKLRSYILTHRFRTANGSFKYKQNGTPGFSALVLQWQSGRNVVLWPKKWATGGIAYPPGS